MVPIITIDGPSGSGKGTIARLLADRFGLHCLDSGALYRLVGLAAERASVPLSSVDRLVELAAGMEVAFREGAVFLDQEDVTLAIRTEQAGNAASRVAAVPEVRAALLQWQRNYAREPGLVADGRDMGTVVFPTAGVKIYLTASPEERARRRYNQLKEKGLDASLARLVAEIRERDERDSSRSVAPLLPAPDAQLLESTSLSIAEVLERVVSNVQRVYPVLVKQGA
ncbi:MAG: (d)CMP kinase [Gammaproteobacteria bacterium]|nr:(d)CMP kinase [Gammaproteobacteria bacterium]MCP5416419.1 (d)CMP kinase [Chromatiaceae bacterium]